jgi:CheY-like chemotaxis protein
MKILVVDDSKIMKRITVNTLNQLKKDNVINFDDTVEAEDGLEVWQVLQENVG